eukprot:TRINITY_DN36727_c0_g1_i4.p1 TRINITY_DN36727_c0_g1~~TRINITY_DN36727_c0_g1_i4.p1  ORF type:complete len:109 (-),score=6.92 TRINITY_DN36727_c0_g1_i4:125-451(-)
MRSRFCLVSSWVSFHSMQGQHQGAHRGAVTAVSVALPLAPAVTVGEDGVVSMWSNEVNEQILTALPHHVRDLNAKSTYRTNSVILDPVHSRLCTGAEDGFIRLWDLTQ